MIPRYVCNFNTENLHNISTDVVVIGFGIAGLYTALEASKNADVVLIGKKGLMESNTRFAQGGIAAVTAESDSPALHRHDTLLAGAGICSYEAVDALVHEGPDRLQELITYGTRFDKDEDGEYELTREGAHSERRILHAQGDATGAEIVRALAEKVKASPRITLFEEHFAIDLLTENNHCSGVLVMKPDGKIIAIRSQATVLATGGAGQLYRYTTNPEIATADGVAMAYRAGAEVKDMEFIQFHPTALCYPDAPRFLISEAVRGEGAILRNIHGERFMGNYHELMELAPRDIVARAIVSEMERTNSTYVYLDITHESEQLIKHRFPTIYEFCLTYGLDMVTDWIPVAPACHYMMGGVTTDLNGETTLPRLFACGEVSCTGVHGANRLASNSLSEAIVFGHRITARLATLEKLENNQNHLHENLSTQKGYNVMKERLHLQKLMLRKVGVKRDAKSLTDTIDQLEKMHAIYGLDYTTQEAFEMKNLLTVALLTARAALTRTESRGGHYRLDYPEKNDTDWCVHLIQSMSMGLMKERASQHVVE
ncbi:L-aspartate oxidase [Brevibacillus daliensis]|uniref:L-aspartate oxidase n=1 Tax=Brevibacillus daliensis TaxID=2892995 RepID=UPI001E4D7F91|nr:L-aspartate oxidase [Brevibacillus daliensis]